MGLTEDILRGFNQSRGGFSLGNALGQEIVREKAERRYDDIRNSQAVQNTGINLSGLTPAELRQYQGELYSDQIKQINQLSQMGQTGSVLANSLAKNMVSPDAELHNAINSIGYVGSLGYTPEQIQQHINALKANSSPYTREMLNRMSSGEQLPQVEAFRALYGGEDYANKSQAAQLANQKSVFDTNQSIIKDNAMTANDLALEQYKTQRKAIPETVNVNTQDLTSSNQNEQQSNLINARNDLNDLRVILSNADPDLFQSVELVTNSLANKASKFGIPLSNIQEDYTIRREQLFTPVERYFNKYRQDITGAAASEAELARLRKSFINTDLSYTQFIERVNVLMDGIESSINQSSSVLQNGVDVSLSETEQNLQNARKAIRDGADRDKVIELLEQNGIDSSRL